MIHQHIYASPKPGMSEAEFQRYWLEVHAVQYASKIRQIKKYKVDTRIPWTGEQGPPLWNGVAEIWLRNEQEQLESLQSKEFLEGARLDEPKWAAFWNTLVLDTDAHEQQNSPGEKDGVKLLILAKRRSGMPLDEFRRVAVGEHAPMLAEVPGVTAVLPCTTRDSWYQVGEPRFDGIFHMWFEGRESLEACKDDPAFVAAGKSAALSMESKYRLILAVQEHWIIGPGARE